uniref:Uncharacterized protein n=1 Tax=Plectus sambesii TaxID=2011161 RepID=A0A914UM16_9BILA
RQTQKISWQDIVNGWKLEMESFASISWGELVEREITHYRAPGEAAQMHEKLSSPSRKRNQEDVGRRHEERLAKADDLRLRLQAQKAKRLKELSTKVDEVRIKREKLIEKKRALLETRMEKAEENRRKNIDDIVRRARDDDLKVQEINFINTLEAGNMRHDLLARHQDHEHRIQSIQEERLKRSKEKAAKEAAAEERRRLADGERQNRLREMAEKKRLRYDQMEVQKTEQERDRLHAAKEKQRQHQERIADIKAAEHAESEKLKRKIQQKIVESSRRHEESLELVKQKAVELCSPRPTDSWVALADWNAPPKPDHYELPKACAVCKIQIRSDLLMVGHLCGVEHRKKRNLSAEISEETLV